MSLGPLSKILFKTQCGMLLTFYFTYALVKFSYVYMIILMNFIKRNSPYSSKISRLYKFTWLTKAVVPRLSLSFLQQSSLPGVQTSALFLYEYPTLVPLLLSIYSMISSKGICYMQPYVLLVTKVFFILPKC